MGRKDSAAMSMTVLTIREAMIAKRPTSQMRPQAILSLVSEPVDEWDVCVFVVDNFLFSFSMPAQMSVRLETIYVAFLLFSKEADTC
jgi:hypothetical protein